MLQLEPNSFLIESADELHTIKPADVVFADLETSSGSDDLESTNPHHNCSPLGVAITTDRDPRLFYVPWGFCVPWLEGFLLQCKVWVNHNIKYDAHVLANSGVNIPEHLVLYCTIAHAHLIDADRSYKGGYGLDALAKSWLPKIYRKAKESLLPYLGDSKDYGVIPTTVLAKYANIDIFVNRALWTYIECNRPEGTERVWENETHLTKVLWGMERHGLHINPPKVAVANHFALQKMVEIEQKIHDKLGYPVNPASDAAMHDLVIVNFQQDAVKWTDGGKSKKRKPSFNREALETYIDRPETPDLLREVLELCDQHRRQAQMRSLFFESWLKLHKNGVLHAYYNQNLRTGRLSCKEPNEQQLNKQAKALILPAKGYRFLSFDQSQVEFRLIIHFIQDAKAIATYEKNPDTDFHTWVSEMCGVARRPAKTINFSIAYGQGERELGNKLIAEARKQKKPISIADGRTRARNLRRTYFKELPSLIPMGKLAENLARERGYIRNAIGRRLHLPGRVHNLWYDKNGQPIDRCHIALGGRAVQGTAADICKFHAVSIQPLLKKWGVRLVALVHDEYLFEVPEMAEELMLQCAAEIRTHLETAPFPLRVPLRVEGGWSNKSWADCDNPSRCDLSPRRLQGKLSRPMLDPYTEEARNGGRDVPQGRDAGDGKSRPQDGNPAKRPVRLA